MKITQIDIRNFLTISEASLALSDKGLVLLQGENLDDPSATSNGAGKSSITDALCWGFFGTTARGVSGDDVVNNVAKKNCMVEVTVEDETGAYRVSRYRKDKTHKNQLYVGKFDPIMRAYVDLSKGTDRETQEVVKTIIGCSEDVFRSSVYSGQESMPNLPGMTDKFLKLLIEEAAGVEHLSKAYEIARQMANRERSDLDALTGAISRESAALTGESESLAVAEAKFDGFEVDRKGKSDEHKALAKAWAEEAKLRMTELAAAGEDHLRESLALADKKLEGRDAQNKELLRLQKEEGAAHRAFSSKMMQVDAAKRALAHAESDVANVSDKVGKPCGECGKPYHEHDIEDAKKIAEGKVAEARGALRKEATEAKGFKTALDAAAQAVKRFEESMEDFSVMLAHQRDLRQSIEDVEAKKRRVEEAKATVVQQVEAAHAAMTTPNPYAALVESKRQSIEAIMGRIKALQDKITACEERCEDLDGAVKVFGPAGVRARVLDTVTPFLNDRTSEYLGALSDGSISAVWSTLGRTKAGDLKEKFAIDVTNEKGANSFLGLSGGEKRKVRLATALALQDLVASRATKPIDLFIGDEIDDALDPAGLERLMAILEGKARERGTVLVVSHSDLRDWIDSVAIVTKSGGVSTVSGALS